MLGAVISPSHTAGPPVPPQETQAKKGDLVGHHLGGKGKQKVFASSTQKDRSSCWVAREILKLGFVEQNLTWGGAVDGEGHLDILKGWILEGVCLLLWPRTCYWKGLLYTGEC